MMVHHLRGFHGQGIQLSSCFNDLRSSSPIGPPSWQNTKNGRHPVGCNSQVYNIKA